MNDIINWDEIAAQVLSNFALTGKWFVGPLDPATPPQSPPPGGPVLPEATITGTQGNDALQETLGVDVFLGGDGPDLFSFGVPVSLFAQTGTGVGAGARDVVLDFEQGADRIDLSTINLFTGRGPVDLAFDFIGTAEFTPGFFPQARYETLDDRTIVQLDGTSARGPLQDLPDGVVDAEVELVGTFDLTASDFIL